MAIDEIAEQVTEQCCAEAGDIAFYSEDRGYVEFGRPRAILLIDPIDGTRPAAAGLESCCVSVAVLPASAIPDHTPFTPPLHSRIAMAWRSDAPTSPAARAFVAHARRVVGD
jgi:DNA-binding transcriptional LysR family regulator